MIRMFPPSTPLLQSVAQDIEEADALELVSGTGCTDILQILEASRDQSFECYVACFGSVPVAVFGIALDDPADGSVGVPWAVFTKTMRDHPRELVRTSRIIVSRWRSLFAVLENLVDKRNTRAVRWLESLGFTMGETLTSAGGDPFYLFEMRNV